MDDLSDRSGRHDAVPATHQRGGPPKALGEDPSLLLLASDGPGNPWLVGATL